MTFKPIVFPGEKTKFQSLLLGYSPSKPPGTHGFVTPQKSRHIKLSLQLFMQLVVDSFLSGDPDEMFHQLRSPPAQGFILLSLAFPWECSPSGNQMLSWNPEWAAQKGKCCLGNSAKQPKPVGWSECVLLACRGTEQHLSTKSELLFPFRAMHITEMPQEAHHTTEMPQEILSF